jgi:hypothetical protein
LARAGLPTSAATSDMDEAPSMAER